MTGILFRTFLAVIVVALFLVLAPALFRVLGVPLSGDVWFILRLCFGALALLYIVFGRSQPPGF